MARPGRVSDCATLLPCSLSFLHSHPASSPRSPRIQVTMAIFRPTTESARGGSPKVRHPTGRRARLVVPRNPTLRFIFAALLRSTDSSFGCSFWTYLASALAVVRPLVSTPSQLRDIVTCRPFNAQIFFFSVPFASSSNSVRPPKALPRLPESTHKRLPCAWRRPPAASLSAQRQSNCE
jgi:hypothetical protein